MQKQSDELFRSLVEELRPLPSGATEIISEVLNVLSNQEVQVRRGLLSKIEVDYLNSKLDKLYNDIDNMLPKSVKVVDVVNQLEETYDAVPEFLDTFGEFNYIINLVFIGFEDYLYNYLTLITDPSVFPFELLEQKSDTYSAAALFKVYPQFQKLLDNYIIGLTLK